MIKQIGRQKRLSLKDELNIYKEAFTKTTIGINIMFTSDHKAYNDLSFLLRYYYNRNNKKGLKELVQILDKYTTVEPVADKTYPGRQQTYSYKFTQLNFTEEIKTEIEKIYKESTKIVLYKGNIEK